MDAKTKPSTNDRPLDSDFISDVLRVIAPKTVEELSKVTIAGLLDVFVKLNYHTSEIGALNSAINTIKVQMELLKSASDYSVGILAESGAFISQYKGEKMRRAAYVNTLLEDCKEENRIQDANLDVLREANEKQAAKIDMLSEENKELKAALARNCK
jgi:hypothetical protein